MEAPGFRSMKSPGRCFLFPSWTFQIGRFMGVVFRNFDLYQLILVLYSFLLHQNDDFDAKNKNEETIFLRRCSRILDGVSVF